MLRVEQLESPDQLDPLRVPWAALWAETRGTSFFESLPWIQAYWRRFGGEQRMRVLVVRHGPSILGALPVTVKPERTRAGVVRVLTYPLDEWGSFFGPLGPQPTATLAAALRHLANSPRDWDLVDFRWIDRRGRDRGRTATAMRIVGWTPRQRPWRRVALVDLAGDWNAYLASRTPRFRANVRRAIRRMERAGRVRLVRHRPAGAAHGDDDPCWDVYDQCVELARRSWQGASRTGTTLSHERTASFFRETHELAARAGAVDMNLLLVDRRPAAFAYNYYHPEGRLIGLRMGYDPQLAPLSPGVVLIALMLRDSFQRGDRQLDLGAGSLAAKSPWMTGEAFSYRCTYYPPAAVRAQLLRAKHWWTAWRTGLAAQRA